MKTFNSLLLLYIAFLVCGCLSIGGSNSGSADLSSTSTCGGIDPINPTPPLPTAMTKSKLYISPLAIERFSQQSHDPRDVISSISPFSLNPVSIPQGTHFVKVVDPKCAGTKVRAHKWTIPYTMSVQSLSEMAESEPCLVSMEVDMGARPFATTNDPQFASLTHLPVIGAEDAYDIFYDGTNGINSDVVVAIIDSGIQLNHPDLANQLWVNTGETDGNSIDDDGNGFVDDIHGYNLASNLASPAAENGATHGIHVSGLAAAEGDNAVGVTGVIGRNVSIMSLNVFGADETSASSTDIINAIYYAADMGADVINLSLGGPGPSPATKTALEYAVAQGSFVVAAAGNSSVELNTSTVPAGYGIQISGMLAVGSQEVTTLELSSFSNYSGTYVEIAAPGSDANNGGLLSTLPTSTYGTKQGTSMASPVVAGSAAIAISLIRTMGGAITPAVLEELILGSSTLEPSLNGKVRDCNALNLKTIAENIIDAF